MYKVGYCFSCGKLIELDQWGLCGQCAWDEKTKQRGYHINDWDEWDSRMRIYEYGAGLDHDGKARPFSLETGLRGRDARRIMNMR